MSVQTLFFILLVLACPVGMMFMMRGSHHMMSGSQDTDAAAQERRIVELEQEIARLRNTESKTETPELIGPRS